MTVAAAEDGEAAVVENKPAAAYATKCSLLETDAISRLHPALPVPVEPSTPSSNVHQSLEVSHA
jgi:hypothetical protein